MRKTIDTTFCILMLCSLLVLTTAGTTIAAEPGYERISYSTVNIEPEPEDYSQNVG